MIRLAISVEGRTEEEFVKNVLADYLLAKGVESQPILLNGNVTIERLASDIARLIRSFNYVTSLVDFYGFRGKNTATPQQLEQRIFERVDSKINSPWDQSRVISYVQQYEFEGLLFSNVDAFANAIEASEESIEKLRSIRVKFPTPEDINDNSETAPSKRIVKIISQYQKVLYGSLIAMEIGLDAIRAECPRFSDWLTRLESLGRKD